jgi:prohibitin 1
MGYFATIAIVLVVVVFFYFAPLQRARISRLQVGLLGVLVLGIITVRNMVYQVPAGHVGLVYAFGGIVGQRPDGLQWVAPWQEIRFASVQVQGHSFPKLESFSRQSQDVYVAATINVQVSPQHIQDLFREVGQDYFNVLVRPRLFQAVKDETVKYDSVDIAPNREAIRRSVRERLTTELETHSISVQDLLIDNISFSPKFQDAIEEKQRQSQLALAEREKVAAEKAKADQAIEQARGQAQAVLVNAEKQAEANRKLAESITPEYIQYLFATRLAPNVSVMMVPAGQPFILNADMLKQASPARAPQTVPRQ